MSVQNGHCEHCAVAMGGIGTLDVGSEVVDHVQFWLVLNVIVSGEDEIHLRKWTLIHIFILALTLIFVCSTHCVPKVVQKRTWYGFLDLSEVASWCLVKEAASSGVIPYPFRIS